MSKHRAGSTRLTHYMGEFPDSMHKGKVEKVTLHIHTVYIYIERENGFAPLTIMQYQNFSPFALLAPFIQWMQILAGVSTGEPFSWSWRLMLILMIYQPALAQQTNVPCLHFF